MLLYNHRQLRQVYYKVALLKSWQAGQTFVSISFGRLGGSGACVRHGSRQAEPIVCTPNEASRCLLRTKMTALAFTPWAHSAIGNFLVEKEVTLAG